jgi:hypothetical protein
MTDLTREQRRALETSIKAAREEAEIAAAEALRGLRVPDAEAPAGFDPERRAQRKRLRAHARALDDKRAANGAQAITRLTEQAAYVQWHRLLFARFLVERELLRDETGAPVSLTDCREIALDLSADEDEWSVASRFAAGMLPGVFPQDDPVESLRLTRERGRELRNRVLSIDAAVFQADDSLGWTYQFWRAAEKEAVNKSQVKIGAAELPAVTQLFTEPYMVRFLLHNTLGAWWAGKVLAGNPTLARERADEAALRRACALPGYAWDFLRFVQEDGVWRPAAGTFPGWPTTAKALTVLDPCCGSGHFLTEALAALTALRVVEERLSAGDGVAAVLRDNLAGLEIDGRCVQIAAFALALAAWRIGGPGVALPTPNVAWVGAPPPLPKAEFVALANGDAELRRGLGALHDLFVQAPLLGSLIQPIGGDLVDPMRVARIEDSISALVEKMRDSEPERAEGAVAARGMADAAATLAKRWTLQATNVPFLGRGRQDVELSTYLAARYDVAKADLATAMLTRMRGLSTSGGTICAVTPQNWLFLGGYKKLREALLAQTSFALVNVLGEHGFDSSAAAGAFTALVILTEARPSSTSCFAGLDASKGANPIAKALDASEGHIRILVQTAQSRNPDSRVAISEGSEEKLLSDYAISLKGIATGDLSRFIFRFWEPAAQNPRWRFIQEPPTEVAAYVSRSGAILWDDGAGELRSFVSERLGENGVGAWLRGEAAWGRAGVAVAQMRSLPATIYTGELFDESTGAIVPKSPETLPAIWEFVCSKEYGKAVREIDRSLKVPTLTLLKVPFDITYWQGLAEEKYPNGLPEPYSDDPTQWLFHGHPRHASSGTELHAALARLAGYRWPAEDEPGIDLSGEARTRLAEVATLPSADADGLLPHSPLLGERGLADRLRAFCIAAWGADWQPGTEAALVSAACDLAKDKRPAALTLDAWLRTHAARQHAKLFHDRPFLWWITDGRADGFTAIAHYHRLTKDKLERLAFQMIGDHLTRLGDDPRAEAARILQRKLERIIEGEAPYDIFVRWKPLHAQPLGWEPDLNDGVRLNIRPFIEAGVLAHVPNVKYTVDRGKDVPSAPWYGVFGGERRNDHHTTLTEKREARAKANA